MGTYNDDRARLLELLKELSFAERDVTLASGQTAGWYIDCKQTALTGEGHLLIGRLFLAELDRVERGTKGIGMHTAVSGMSIGADPLCSALALTACQAGRTLNAIFVRKEAKGHGTGAFLEGTAAVDDGATVILVEDVVTTGGSTLKAAERVREGGYKVDHVLALVDRQAGGAENLQKAGLTLHALFGPADFGVG
jgi:orotate phosphoribosyltransferase